MRRTDAFVSLRRRGGRKRLGPYTDRVLFGRLMGEARPFWGQIAVIFAIDLLATPLALLVPVPLKVAVDSGLGDHPLPGFLEAIVPGAPQPGTFAVLVLAALLLVTVEVLSQLQQLAGVYAHTYTGERVVLRFRSRLFAHVQRLSTTWHDRRGPMDSLYRIQYDAPAIQHVAIDGLLPLLTAVCTLVAMIAIIASIDWVLAAVALAVAPVLILLTRAYRRPLRVRYRDVKDLETSSLNVVQEVLGAMRVVKAFGKERHEEERFADRSRATAYARTRLSLFQGGFDLLVGVTTAAGMATVLLVGMDHVRTERITLGELLLVMGYLAALYVPLRTISNKAGDIQSSLASAERVFAILDEAPDVVERPGARPLDRAAGDIAFCHVAFEYEPGHPVLSGVTLRIRPGTRVGIAGPTGAGKTTLVSLLTRFFDPTEGSILLDGFDLREYRLADLRRQFAIVLQEPVLFSTSIGENIAYARPGAAPDEVVAAARAAKAHDFIERLPDGYATAVGDRGMRLSGGERQRIALARAFLRDASVLILDEPTSSVDMRTEEGIMEALERLMEGRTTLMIAHRLSTLGACDLRVEVDGGRLSVRPPEAVAAG